MKKIEIDAFFSRLRTAWNVESGASVPSDFASRVMRTIAKSEESSKLSEIYEVFFRFASAGALTAAVAIAVMAYLPATSDLDDIGSSLADELVEGDL